MTKTVSHSEFKRELHKSGRFTILAIAFVLFACWLFQPENSLNKCQESHSFDTCFTSLNR